MRIMTSSNLDGLAEGSYRDRCDVRSFFLTANTDDIMIDPSVVPAIRVQQLLVVLALAEHNSFAATAAALRTSQPAVTRTLQRVERLIGTRLFIRDSRRVEITPAGRAFVALAERSVDDLRRTLTGIGQAGVSPAGAVTVATFASFAAQMLPGLIGVLRRSHRDVEVRIRERHQSEIVDDVRQGSADFGVGYINDLPDTVEGRALGTEYLYALLPVSHPLAAHAPAVLPLESLTHYPLVSLPLETHLRRIIDLAAASRGIQLRHDVVVERAVSVVSHVEAGVGVGILPSGALAATSSRRVHAAMIDPPLSVSIGLITAPGRYLSRPASVMVSLIIDGFEQVEQQRRQAL
jgi:DNA-binding transcriptional LysR family regulator